MRSLKQIGLLPAGCQPWNMDVCVASGDRFAYSATLAVYIYELDCRFREFKLHSIMSEHTKTITCLAWSPHDRDHLASASTDCRVIVWNVPQRRLVAVLDTNRPTVALGYCRQDGGALSFTCSRGPLSFWAYATPSGESGGSGGSGARGGRGGLSLHRQAQHFTSDVCCLRWHPHRATRLVIGHRNGTVSLYCQGVTSYKQVRVDDADGSDADDWDEASSVDAVTALDWDPLSSQYLLVASPLAGVRLVDADTASVLRRYAPPSAATQLRCAAWLDGAPGLFATADAHAGVLRFWTVSNSAPLESIRLKQTGFHALHIFATTTAAPTPTPAVSRDGRGGTSKMAVPPLHAVCVFLDGGVGLYDLSKRRWNFLRDFGHIETIFDCKFKPDDHNLLATGSFDGTIKIWDVDSLTAVDSSPGNEGVIYSLSWAPADLNCIAASTSRNGAFIWDIDKAKIITRIDQHAGESVYAIAWNQKDSSKIATVGGDGNCIIHQVDGKVLVRYKHPGPVFGCDWHPSNKDLIATSCEDKCVRVFYIATTSQQPLKVFTGHTAKVFQVKWSPLRDGFLASGSDDHTVRVWDYSQTQCVRVLAGHTAPVRGLLWSPELPSTLVSGSWDYAIRVWDTRDGRCVDTVVDHGADVYGLACHPKRPCVIASCSRDSTVRLWSMMPLLQPLEMLIIAGRPLVQICDTTDNASADDSSLLLCGRESRLLHSQLVTADGCTRLTKFFQFLSSAGGTENLWELAAVINGRGDGELSKNYSRSIMHSKHVTKFNAAAAKTMELVKMARFGAGVGAPTRESRLHDAAMTYACVGGLQRYCELMAGLDQWDKALSVAPGVSMEYWKSLADRRSSQLIDAGDSHDVVPLCVATGNARQLVTYFQRRGQRQDAMTVACAVKEGSISCASPPSGGIAASRTAAVANSVHCAENDDGGSNLLHTTSCDLAEWHFSNGMAVRAACCHLAADNIDEAILKLIRGNELELAVALSRVLSSDKMAAIATRMLARRCERLGEWNLAIEMILQTDPTDITLAEVCARCGLAEEEKEALHAQAGFPSMKECLQTADELSARPDDLLECVKHYLLSTSPETGLKIGLDYVKRKMSSSSWTADDVFDVLQMMSCTETERLQRSGCATLRAEMLVMCAYVGALVAIQRGYDAIVPSLFMHAEFLLERDSADVPLSISRVAAERDAWIAHQVATSDGTGSSANQMSIEHQDHYTQLLRKAGAGGASCDVGRQGAFVVTGSCLPSHSADARCCLTSDVIQGPVFYLEDGKSAISLNWALMWAIVNPFSPLGSAARINPF